MKKRVLSVLLVIALLVTVGVVAAQANETDPTPAEIYAEAQTIISAAEAMTFEEGNLPTYCPKCGEGVTWTAVTAENLNGSYLNGHYYLADNLTSTSTGRFLVMGNTKESCLHLNGHSITSEAESGFNSIIVGSSNPLNIYDNDGGKLDGASIKAALQPGAGGMNIYGGTYTSTESNGIVFDIRSGCFMNFFGGQTTSNMVRVNGGAIFNAYGGIIGGSEIRSTQGNAYVNLYEDVVVNATKGVNTYNMYLVMDGGHLNKFTNSTTTNQSLSISGDAVIDNLSGALTNNGVKPTFGTLTEGASIGFGTYTGVISTAYATKEEAQAIADTFPAMTGLEVTVDEESFELVLGPKTYTPAEIVTESAKQSFTGTETVNAFCYACGGYKDWTPLTAEASSITGHYFLAADEITSTNTNGTIYANAAGTLCLHLNGKTIGNTKGVPAIRNWSATMNVMGNGIVQSSGNFGWGALHCAGVTTNVYGGTYQSNSASNMGIVCGAGATNIYAATITEGKGVFRIQCQYATSSPNVTIYGGTYPNKLQMYNKQGPSMILTIKGGTFNNIDAISDLTIEGGTINGAITSTVAATIKGGTINNTVTASAGTLTVSGGTVNNTVTVSGATATVSNGSLTALTVTGGNATVSGGNVTDMTVSGGAATVSGGTVTTLTASAGNVAVSGGTVTTANISGTAVTTLSNAPALSTLNVATGVAVNAKGLTGGTINLGTTSGVFTTAFDDADAAKAAKAYFVIGGGMDITVTDANELSYNAKVYTTEEKVTLSQAQDFGSTNEVVNKFCYHCGSYQDWTPLSEGGTGTITLTTGHYYLNNDIKFTGATAAQYGYNIGTESHVVCLHLNGNDIVAEGQTYTAIRAWSGNLNLMGTGLVQNKADNWAAVCVNYGATTNIYGGTFNNTYGVAEQAIDLRATTVNIYDAEILQSNVLRVIPNNTSRHPVVTIHDGTYPAVSVTPNATTLDNATLNVKGGAITTLTAGGIVNVEGGTITTLANSASSNTITLSGAPTISALSLTASTVLPNAKGLTGGTIGLGTTSGVFTTAFDSKADAEAVKAYFVAETGMVISVTELFELSYDAKVYTPAEIVTESAKQVFEGTDPVDAFCYACGEVKTWKPLTEAATVYQGIMQSHYHWFVANDITYSGDGTFTFASYSTQQTWCIHINGKTLYNPAGSIIRQWNGQCFVNVMGDGELSTSAMNFGAIHANGGTNATTGLTTGVNVYFSGDINSDGGNGRSITVGNGNSPDAFLNLYSGNVTNKLYAGYPGTTVVYGGEIEMIELQGSTAALTLENGTVNTFRMWGTCDATVNGGTINKLDVSEDGGTIKLAGKPTVGTVTLADGKVLDLNGVTGGSIGIGSTEGVFTTAFTGGESAANAAAAFVTSPTMAVSVTGANELTAAAGQAAVVNGENQKAYADYAAAEAAYTEGYIKLLSDAAIVMTKNATIDLNGQIGVAISGTGELTGFDSTTANNFSKVPGSALITGISDVKGMALDTAEDGTVKGYIAVTTDEGETTFTYYQMKLSGVALKAKSVAGVLSDVGMYYKGTWSFNENLPEGYVEAGVVVNIGDPATLAPGASSSGWYSKEATAITNGEPMTSVLVDGIMTADEAKYDANTSNGQTDINAAAFVTVGGENILTGIKSLSVRDVLYAIETNADALAANEGKLYGDGKFYALWTPYVDFTAWDLPEYTARVN